MILLKKIFLDIIGQNDIKVGQCYELYNLLGGDESEALKGININIKEDDDDDEENEGYQGKLRFNKKKMNY